MASPPSRSHQYAEWTGLACKQDGIRYVLEEVEPHQLEQRLEEANQDPAIHGILIYYPVFGSRPSFFGTTMDDYLRDKVGNPPP